MLIRSQNKQNIFNINGINGIVLLSYYKDCELCVATSDREYSLGRYSTKEKAIKVLDMIEEAYNEPAYINDLGSGEYAKYNHPTFYMPEDNEVIVDE